MSEPARVRNAADREQVAQARSWERRDDERRRAALKAVMDTAPGRAMLADLLEDAGIYGSILDHSGSMMYFKEGRRNFGLELFARIMETDEELAELLERERRARRRADNRETDAAHTPRAVAKGE